MKSDSTKKKRINITIDAELHELAAAHARSSHYTDFSGLITKLLRDDMRQPAPEPLPSLADFVRARQALENPNPHEPTPKRSRNKSKP